MGISQPPPKPDRRTGEPRPPQAPVEPDWRPSQRAKLGSIRPFSPPDNEGPVLEWYQASRIDSIMPAVLVSLIIGLFLTLKDFGFEWMGVWWLWAFVLWPAPALFFAIRTHRMSAGADWYQSRKDYIKTYELVSVKVTTGGAAYYLDLEDTGGRKMSTQLDNIQQNRQLWDLVYNGILHSVHRKGATTNQRAQDHLQLMTRRG